MGIVSESGMHRARTAGEPDAHRERAKRASRAHRERARRAPRMSQTRTAGKLDTHCARTTGELDRHRACIVKALELWSWCRGIFWEFNLFCNYLNIPLCLLRHIDVSSKNFETNLYCSLRGGG